MYSLRVLVFVGMGVAGVSACTVAGSKDHFMQSGVPKAAFDLKCDAGNLEIDELGERSVGVQGCGKRARYVYVSGAGWVQN